MGEDNFSSTLDSLKGFQVNLYVGEEIITGKLMGVETDHIVIEDENKYIFYYNIDKIQAITKNTKQFKSAEITDYVKTQSLRDLLLSLKNTWVTILCVNNKTFSGVLSIVDSDFVTLISGEERILVKILHISNILKGYKKQENSNTTDNTATNNEGSTEVPTETNKQETESSKVIMNESKNEKKVWSEPIKNTSDKTVIVASSKTNKEIKKSKSEKSRSDSKQNNSDKKQIQAKETKIQKNEVIHQVNNREKENHVTVIDNSREAPPMLMNNTSPKEEQTKRPIKNIQKELETPPLVKMESMKKTVTENKKLEEKPKAQEVGVARFAGEPARNLERRSIFSGWPNRKPVARRF
jgi:hypothetical protein